MRPSSVRENGTPKCSSSMTAGIALRHMYSIASWSPSQSDPLTVSYMCQRQSSSPIFPSAAPMPPCAATVWLRVGKTLEMQAVLSPSTFQRVADHQPPDWPTGSAPKQIHLELAVDDLEAAEARALELGASKAAEQPSPERWRVLLDPAGHPF